MKSLNKIIEELIAENEKLQSNMNLHFAETFQLQEENKKLKQQIEGLHSENFELENRLFTQELNEDETEDYIDSLKKELFQIYINKRY